MLLDPLTRFNTSGKSVSFSSTGDLNTIADLLARYGIAFDAGVVGDTELAAQVMSETQAKQAYPFWLRVARAQVAGGFPAVASLNDLLFVEPGSLRLSNGAQALISTTHRSGTLPAAAISSGAIAETAAKLKPDGKTRVSCGDEPDRLAKRFHDGFEHRGIPMSRNPLNRRACLWSPISIGSWIPLRSLQAQEQRRAP